MAVDSAPRGPAAVEGGPGPPVILVVDDEPGIRGVLEITFKRQGYAVVALPGVEPACQLIAERREPFPLVVTDLVMPDGSGLAVLAAARKKSPQTEVIVMTAYSTVEAAIDTMRQGAYDFVTKPFSPSEMVALAQKALEKSAIVAENERLRARLDSLRPDAQGELFSGGPVMERIGALVAKIAPTRTTVLITGESGTGKERVARALHDASDRAGRPFCVINCGALPEALMESELFGHEKGSFTGATHAHAGLFRQADVGTLLLDEVGELPPLLQVKLLRVLQERKVRPVGSTTEVAVDVRVLAATNRDVEQDVEAGRFRKDLYYRLNVIRIELPPLRERSGAVRRLAERFVARFAAEQQKEVRGLTPDAQRALEHYPFPGNIRELENMMERAVALAAGPAIAHEDLPDHVTGRGTEPAVRWAELPEGGCELDALLERAERQLLEQAMRRAGGKRTGAAKLLGITFRSLRYRLAKLGMASEDDSAEDDGEK
ncbi:MAG: sigma-54-dependent Fis family transcriptional regulator [Myxococcales bacterium]|nr:sigma-54-dependent Fis family transcriptional regulator [Myxococcales bacterium]